MSDVTLSGFNHETFTEFVESRHEPTWVTDQRRRAWQRFSEMEWPARNSEEWSRTDFRLFKLDRYSLPTAPVPCEMPVGDLAAGVELGGQSISLDGHSQKSEVQDVWSKKGVIFGSLAGVLSEHGERLRPYLDNRVVDPFYDRFAALHSACWTGGHVLFVPRGVVVDQPFHALSVLNDGSADLGRLLVVLEDGAEATLLFESAGISEDSGGMHCGANELIVGQGANLRFVNLQQWGKGTWNFGHQKAVVHQDALIQWTIAAMGSRLSKVNQQVDLAGPGANCQVNGVMFTEDKQHISYHTTQRHVSANCNSDFLYKAALQDQSRTVWRGMIKVDPGADKTDGYQRNDNLLLSTKARADSIPGLEIEADDVRCTHGSTTGKVDEELVFYACCRGFTRKEAIRMIVSGFFQQIFDRITIESVREALGHAIARRVREYD